jgi:K+-sensing histidine kinase KdpD
VPEAALGRLFEKFYRVERRGEGARRGVGIGLAVVQGLVVAMGGGIAARRSELGGLAVCIDLRAAVGEQRPAGTAVSSVEPRA